MKRAIKLLTTTLMTLTAFNTIPTFAQNQEPSSSATTEISSATTPSETTQSNEAKIRVRREPNTKEAISYSTSSGTKTKSHQFYIEPRYGYVKIWVKNKSSIPISFTVTQDSTGRITMSSGTQAPDGIRPRQSIEVYSGHRHAVGYHTLNINGNGTANISVEYAGRMGKSVNALKGRAE